VFEEDDVDLEGREAVVHAIKSARLSYNVLLTRWVVHVMFDATGVKHRHGTATSMLHCDLVLLYSSG
jgi:hypothetical protein